MVDDGSLCSALLYFSILIRWEWKEGPWNCVLFGPFGNFGHTFSGSNFLLNFLYG